MNSEGRRPLRWRCAGDALAVVLAIGRPGVLAICWLLGGVRWRYVGDHSGGALAIFFFAGDFVFLQSPFRAEILVAVDLQSRAMNTEVPARGQTDQGD